MGASAIPIMMGAGSALSTGASVWQNQKSLNAQRQENEKNRQWQSSENAIDRDWQQQMQESSLQSQQDFQKEMFNLQNEYNLPSNEIARLRAAGVNVGAMMSGGNSLISAGSSTSFPQSPGASFPGSHGVTMPGQLSVPQNSIAQMFSSLAQMQESVAMSKKAGVEAAAIETKLPGEVQKLSSEVDKNLSETDLNKAKTALTAFETTLKQNYGDARESAEISKILNESFQAFASGQASEARQLLDRANERLTSIESKIKQEAFPQLVEQVGILNNLYKSEHTKNVAQAGEAVASAALKRSETTLNGLLQRIRSNEADISDSTFRAQLNGALEQARQVGIINDKLWEELQILRKDKKWYTPDKIEKYITDVLHAIPFSSSSSSVNISHK